jgi:hypothetical protein
MHASCDWHIRQLPRPLGPAGTDPPDELLTDAGIRSECLYRSFCLSRQGPPAVGAVVHDDPSTSYAGHDELIRIVNVTPEQKLGESLRIRSTLQRHARTRVSSPEPFFLLPAQTLPLSHRHGPPVCNSANFNLASIGSR